MSLNKNVPRDLTQKTISGFYTVFNKEWVAGGMKGGMLKHLLKVFSEKQKLILIVFF